MMVNKPMDIQENGVKHILLIEDNADHALLAKRSLERSGAVEVLTAATAGDGLSKLKSENFDLIVCDYQLPDINGLELLQRLKEEEISAPFIMLTGRGDEQTAVSAMRFGAYDYVVKDEVYLHILPRAVRDAILRFRDDQQKKILEQEVIEKNRQLEQANRELLRLDDLKNQFIASVTHEFRTPLNAVQESLALLTDGIIRNDTKQYKHVIDIVIRNLKRLGTLIDDLLDFSKLEAGKMRMVLEPHSLKEMVVETVESLNDLVHSRNLTIETGALDVPEVVCDRHRIIQVLTNLIGNAVKFTPPPGKIRIWAEVVLDGKVKVNVRDTGVGIDPKMHMKIFEKFEQVEKSVPGSELKGTGLGLAICRHIIEKHSGSIWVESEPNRGSTFMFTLHTQQTYQKGGE